MFLQTSVYFAPRKISEIMGSKIHIAIMWMVVKIQSQFKLFHFLFGVKWSQATY